MMTFHSHLKRAIEITGSQRKLAEAIGCSQQHVSFLMHHAKTLSGEIAVKIERATDGQITRHELRPDLFEPPVEAGSAA